MRLTQYPDCLWMTVTDGRRAIPNGTDLRRFVAERHFGLAGMRELAVMIVARWMFSPRRPIAQS